MADAAVEPNALGLTATWSQRRRRLLVSVRLAGAVDATSPPSVEITEPCVRVTWGTAECTMPLFSTVTTETSTWRQLGERLVEITLAKASAGPYWPRLLALKASITWLQPDWERWIDSDDDSDDGADGDSPHTANAPRAPRPLPPPPEGRATAAELEVPALGGTGWMHAWRELMTTPQRMHTLVRFWNMMADSERRDCVAQLVRLSAARGGEKVKGGGGLFRDLDPLIYAEEPLPAGWLDHFGRLSIAPAPPDLTAHSPATEPRPAPGAPAPSFAAVGAPAASEPLYADRVGVLRQLWQAMPPEEQMLVLSTFC